jgi:phosphomannomutase
MAGTAAGRRGDRALRGANGRNINLHCGALHTEELQRAAIASGADFGVAFDGDADRAIDFGPLGLTPYRSRRIVG